LPAPIPSPKPNWSPEPVVVVVSEFVVPVGTGRPDAEVVLDWLLDVVVVPDDVPPGVQVLVEVGRPVPPHEPVVSKLPDWSVEVVLPDVVVVAAVVVVDDVVPPSVLVPVWSHGCSHDGDGAVVSD
jgi:hypothetical protein